MRDRGLIVDEQVGASEYRIDLAIRDPRDRNRYILAVECDGATYHHTKTARDRDILREEVLRSQGWKIYRVWSTDWFRDREKALKGILSGLEAAKRAPAKDSVLAKPIIQDTNSTEVLLNNDLDTEKQSTTHKRKYKLGVPYHKYSLNQRRSSRELLNKNGAVQLATVITSIVKYESPIHIDVIIERLKEIYGVSRAGANIQKNVTYAIERSTHWSGLINRSGFIYKTEDDNNEFRVPGQGVVRGLNQIAPEEIENAILYLVEDQFGFAREHISKAILEAFGIGRNRAEPIEIIESAVDRLLSKKKLNLNGHTLYLS